MLLPDIGGLDHRARSSQVNFGGLDHNVGAQDGSLWDMSNLCGDNFPKLSTRPHRYLYKELRKPGGIYAWEKLCWVDSGKFYYDGVEKGRVTPGVKTFGSLGAKIVILPDKKYYDVKNDKFGEIESRFAAASLSFRNGTYKGMDAKANTIQAGGINWGDYFQPGDGVTISGCTKHPSNNKTIVIQDIDGDKLRFLENSFQLDPGDNPYTETGEMKIERTMPDLIAVCENGNRLWGCTRDTIHASKLGSIFNWNNFDGVLTNSWAWEPGTVGDFQGCASFRGYPVFFKEDKISKIYGETPAEFRAIESASMGCQEGSGKSLAVAGETLIYLGRTGMTAYTGGIPQPISQPFGREQYTSGVAGSDGLKYYASVKGQDGRHRILVFDTRTGLWHKEDYMEVTHFARWDGNLYGLNTKGEIWLMGTGREIPEGLQKEKDFDWFAETGDFTDDSPNRKNIGKLQLRAEIESEAFLRVLIQYDSDGDWRVVRCAEGEGRKRNVNLPVRPHRCDHYRIRLEGKGDCTIFSMTRIFTRGSSEG